MQSDLRVMYECLLLIFKNIRMNDKTIRCCICDFFHVMSACHCLNISVLHQDPPYMMLKPDSAFLAGNDRFEGYLADILKRLAASVGFEYDIRLSRDGKHGDLRLDRLWDGMLGDLQRGVS
jgi:Ligated ion channel L-glutamate- and glycine-binding site